MEQALACDAQQALACVARANVAALAAPYCMLRSAAVAKLKAQLSEAAC